MRACSFLLATMLLLAATASAQVPGVSATATTSCAGADVVLSVDFYMPGEIPAEYVGWVVRRETIGACVPNEVITDALPWPTQLHETIEVIDTPPVFGRKTLYRLYGRRADGSLEFVLWPSRTNYAQASCTNGPAARGTVVELYPGAYYLEVCPGECWWQMSMFDPHLPPEAPTLVGQQIDVFGLLQSGLEGPYVLVQGWTNAQQPCEASVGTDRPTWTQIKAFFEEGAPRR